MTRRNLRRFRPLSFEQLESRLPLAGNVMMSLSGGNLKITGDAGNNNIALTQVLAGEFMVTGNDGETFTLNGQAFTSGQMVAGVTKGITVDLGAGTNAFALTGLGVGVDAVAKFTYKSSADAANTITLANAKFVSTALQTGKAGGTGTSNNVLLNNVNAGKLATKILAQSNNLDLTGVTAASAKIALLQKTAQGADMVNVMGGTFGGGLYIDVAKNFPGGTPADSVTINNANVGGKLGIKTGDGADTITINGVTGNSAAEIETAGGGDTVNIGVGGASAFASLEVNAAGNTAGNDNVTIQSTTFTDGGRLEVTTGEGADNVALNAVTGPVVGPGATIKTAGGGDTINVGLSSRFNGLDVDAAGKAAGADTVTIQNTSIFIPSNIATGEGADNVTLNSVIVASVTISTAGGADTIAVGLGSHLKLLEINTGNASGTTDRVTVDGGTTVTRILTITTGDGNDLIAINNATNLVDSKAKTTIKTGKGNDTFNVATDGTGNAVIRQADVDLSDGDDVINVGSATTTLVVNGSATVRTKVKGGKNTDTFNVAMQPTGDEFIDVTEFELPA